ncbi:MAG: tRNA pseudouridine(55) synthase TruB [Clostridiales bacterium]|nr:tRNA pseudouridine(55) synthase TruB [Clostridiales bacterium]
MSSARAVAFVRRRFGGAKAGHAGTLDPEAAGVLPIMIGKAARLFNELQGDRKTYIAEIAFGAATDTQDAQGAVVKTGDGIPTERELRDLFPKLVGDMPQTPPMYSALKQGGKRLYALAREGRTVERQPRQMTLFSLELLQMTPRSGALIQLTCSKGFYVRTLCHDIGDKLRCPAHMRFLLRTASGMFFIDAAKTLDEIESAGDLQSLLVPVEDALTHLPYAEVPEALTKQFLNGAPLPVAAFSAFRTVEQGGRVQLRIGGRTAAVARRRGEMIKPAIWLR